MEYFCFEGDGLWESDDAELIKLASAELAKLGLCPGATVTDGAVVRMPKAYPIYDSTYSQHVGAIREYHRSDTNLHTVGRNGMHKYNNQDHSMYTAMLAVENMLGATHDLWEREHRPRVSRGAANQRGRLASRRSGTRRRVN